VPFDSRAFAQTHYFAEIERKKELNSSVQMPVALASAYGAAIVTMIQSTHQPFHLLGILVVLGCAFAAAALGFGLYYLFRAYVGHAYCYVATPDSVLAWREQARSGGWTGRALDNATEQMLADEYATAAAHNAAANDNKSGYLHLANVALGTTLAILIITAVPWLLEKLDNEAQDATLGSITMVTEDVCGRKATTATAAGTRTGTTAPAAAKSSDQGKRSAKGAQKGLKAPPQPYKSSVHCSIDSAVKLRLG
jgi:hypothetical protein